MHVLYVLAFATLVIVLGFGFWQLISVKRSKANRGEPSGSHVAATNVASPTVQPRGQSPSEVRPTPR